VRCGQVYAPEAVEYTCPADEGNLDVLYHYDRIAAQIDRQGWPDERGTWRYRALMPIAAGAPVPPLLVGDTPLFRADRLAANLGLHDLWVKDEGRNPTASFKDRASTLVLARAMAENRPVITTASTGNAAAALAGVAASVGMPTVIFVPASAPPAKITQLLVYGAQVLLVEGTYDDAFELSLAASREYGWYCRNTGYNPYTAEGKKTAAYEICEQLSGQAGQFKAPDRLFVSVGDGNIISGIHKGLKDLLALGWIDHMPRLVGVQAEGSAALYRAWKAGLDPVKMQPIEAHTVADSISAGLPRDRVKAMRAITETDGFFISVSDAEILAAIPALARGCGVFAEPAAAAAYAGLRKAAQDGMLDRDEQVVLLSTGSGLKDIAAAQQALPEQAHRITPTLSALAQVMPQIRGG